MHAKNALPEGKTAQIKPRGHSMTGKVNESDLVTLEPYDPGALKANGIVLVRCGEFDYLYLIKAVDNDS